MSSTSVHPAAAAHSTSRRTRAEARLLLGQCNVGTWVVLALVMATWQPFASLNSLGDEVERWGVVVGVMAAIQLGFDIVGGYILPVRYGRRTADPIPWAGSWIRGLALHAGAMFVIGVLAMAIGRLAGSWAAVAALALVGCGLVGIQRQLSAWTVAGLAAPGAQLRTALGAAGIAPERVFVARTAERSYVGGWVGPRGMERLIVAQHQVDTLDSALLQAVLVRRRLALSSGARAKGVIAALTFNVVGLCIVTALLPGAGFDSAAALLVTASGTTLWGFLGLLTLPTVSRRAVHALDRATAAVMDQEVPGAGSDLVANLVQRLDADQEDELQRTVVVETIFHPVPTPTRRVAHLSEHPMHGRAPAEGCWRVARMALFTSWASLSPLSRAVHCNIGRPELWALLPGD